MADASGTPSDVRRSEGRIWMSRWYRIRPGRFEYYELFFEPDGMYMVFGDESFKSFLLRRDGRDREAHEKGERLFDAPAAELTRNERSFRIDIDDLEEVRFTTGFRVLKPKLSVVTDDRTYEFYHHSRSVDIDPMVTELQRMYAEDEVLVERRTRSLF